MAEKDPEVSFCVAPRIMTENDDSKGKSCCFPSAGRADANLPWEPTQFHQSQTTVETSFLSDYFLPSSSSTCPDNALRGDIGSRFVLVVLYLLF